MSTGEAIMELSQRIDRILAGDIRSIAKTLTEIEGGSDESVRDLLRNLFPHSGRSLVVGVTGSPGAGKSTLVERLARWYSKQKRKVGVIAVDPTSPFSGGAILGDRVRMQSLATDPHLFIRSMATRGRMGGLSAAVGDALVVLDAAGYEILIVETVGAGQDEVEIVKTADATIVVLVPGMGDDIQTIKAGIMEIGDIFVINKADREGVERLRREVEALLSLAQSNDGWSPAVVETVATRGEGIADLCEAIHQFHRSVVLAGLRREQKARFHRLRLLEMIRDRLLTNLTEWVTDEELEDCVEAIMSRERDPYTVVDELSERLSRERGLG